MHVAKAVQVHQNVEAEALPGSEGARQLVVPAAMAEAELYDLIALRCTERGYAPLDLAIRIKAVLVQQRGGEFHLQRLVIVEQINFGDRFNTLTGHQRVRCLSKFTAGLYLVFVRIGILHQRRRYSYRPQQRGFHAFCQCRIAGTQLLHHIARP